VLARLPLKYLTGTLPVAGMVKKENSLLELTVDYKNQLLTLLACLKSVATLATVAPPSSKFKSNIVLTLL